MELSIKGLARFLKDEKGATAIEYALLASGIFLAITTAVQLLGGRVLELYNSVAAGLTAAT